MITRLIAVLLVLSLCGCGGAPVSTKPYIIKADKGQAEAVQSCGGVVTDQVLSMRLLVVDFTPAGYECYQASGEYNYIEENVPTHK